MKNLSLLLFFIFLSSCSTGSITGKTSLGAIESPMWFATVDKRDIRDYYDELSISRLCIKWEASYPGTKSSSKKRGQISDSLERRGENGMYCSNPSSDSTRISEMKMEKEMEKKSKPKQCNKSRMQKVLDFQNSRAYCSTSSCRSQRQRADRLKREMDRICGNGVKSDRDILNEAVGKSLRKLF